MKKFDTALAVIPVKGKNGQYIQVKMRPLEEEVYNPFYALIEAALVTSKTGEVAATPFLYLAAEVFFCKKYGEDAPGVMDSESARWGEIGIQMFDPQAGENGTPRYPVGNVFVLDPSITNARVIDKEVLFADDFDMEGLFAAMLKATSQYVSKGRIGIDYFVFFGNVGYDKDDKLWRNAIKKMQFTDVFNLKETFVCAIPGCFYGVWHNNKLPQQRKNAIFTTNTVAPWNNGTDD